ncbi:hypothetical protein PRIPAC_93354, partial [Pristionchus pacificus]|uniref:Uncharacterized protein n=1 Tax=Pristionchus pacificus TaxID=54126 RepID=A0A2A6BIF6_PRIPA
MWKPPISIANVKVTFWRLKKYFDDYVNEQTYRILYEYSLRISNEHRVEYHLRMHRDYEIYPLIEITSAPVLAN